MYVDPCCCVCHADPRSSPAPGPSSAATQARPTHSFPEDDIQRLTSNGFSRQQVIEELTKTGGNIDQALMALLAKSFQVP